MNDEWEEVPAEDLWEDGELSFRNVAMKLYDKVCCEGNWKVVRRREWDQNFAKKKHKQTPTVL